MYATAIPMPAKPLAERPRRRCLASLAAVHVERQPDHDQSRPFGGAQLTDEGHVVIEVAALDRRTSKRHPGLRVADRDADPAVAVVEAEEPHRSGDAGPRSAIPSSGPMDPTRPQLDGRLANILERGLRIVRGQARDAIRDLARVDLRGSGRRR